MNLTTKRDELRSESAYRPARMIINIAAWFYTAVGVTGFFMAVGQNGNSENLAFRVFCIVVASLAVGFLGPAIKSFFELQFDQADAALDMARNMEQIANQYPTGSKRQKGYIMPET